MYVYPSHKRCFHCISCLIRSSADHCNIDDIEDWLPAVKCTNVSFLDLYNASFLSFFLFSLCFLPFLLLTLFYSFLLFYFFCLLCFLPVLLSFFFLCCFLSYCICILCFFPFLVFTLSSCYFLLSFPSPLPSLITFHSLHCIPFYFSSPCFLISLAFLLPFFLFPLLTLWPK